jgi:hypothetical protein
VCISPYGTTLLFQVMFGWVASNFSMIGLNPRSQRVPVKK